MSKRRRRDWPDSQNLTWTNTTGSSVAADQPVIVRGELYIANTTIADGAQGVLCAHGEYYLDAVSTDTWVQGQTLSWDTSTKKISTDLSKGCFFTALTAKVNGETKASVCIRNLRQVRFEKSYATGDAEVTGNSITIDTGLGFQLPIPVVNIRNSSNVVRLANTVVAQGSGNAGKIVITGSGGAPIANGDTVFFQLSY